MPPKRTKSAIAVAAPETSPSVLPIEDKSHVEDPKPTTTTPKAKKAAAKKPKAAEVLEEDPDDKKRGRKPRGGKIITKQQITSPPQPQITNVVLNLKCSMADLKEYNNKLNNMIINPLEYNSTAPPEVRYYEGTQSFTTFDAISDKPESQILVAPRGRPGEDCSTRASNITCGQCGCSKPENRAETTHVDVLDDDAEDKLVNVKEMSAKLKQLKLQLYKNALQNEKKSACFWCTYDFDNAPCYIPKYEMDGVIYGYGSFCRPECAVAYLMKESIDDSTKFDRYHLLNQIYSKVYDCKKNIKPAPNPHYLLDKFYGNLTIQEYRKLLKTDHLLLVIDKPMTRILPELHEDTDDAFTKIYGIKTTTGTASGVFKVKRQSEQPTGPSKASIVRNSFGLPS